jgi:tetratricopeptide (TPR) repeat protein
MSTGDEPAARALTEKALELDATLAEGHLSRGMVRQYFDWDLSGAEQSFREAINLNPGFAEAHHELGMTLLRVKQYDEALEEARQAALRAPESLRFLAGVGEVYGFSGRYREAIDVANQLLQDDSTLPNGLQSRGFALEGLGRWDDALRDYQACIRPGCDFSLTRIGYIHGRMGRTALALAVLDSLNGLFERKEPNAEGDLAMKIATVYSGLRNKEQTLAWLERARTARAFFMLYLAVDHTFEWLHADPQFQALLERVGLPRA